MAKLVTLSILFVEPNPRVTANYQKLLKESPYLPHSSILSAQNLQEAIHLIQQHFFDLIFLDLFLSDSQNLETFLTINKYAPQSAIIIITREGHESVAFDAISLGAEDYLLENEMDIYTVSRNIRNALERHGLKESLRAMTFTDELTSLYNRRGFFTLARQQIELAKREQYGIFLFLIDLDHLKEINDTFGHHIGDQALMSTAKCLKKTFRSTDIIGRIGGDEFAILVIGTSISEGEKIGKHLLEIVHSFNKEQHDILFSLSLSYGEAYLSPENQLHIEDLLEEADQKLYSAKKISHQKQK